MAAWWLVWVATLTWLLFRGEPVDDDASIRFTDESRAKRVASMLDWSNDIGCALAGCVSELGLILLAIVLVVAGLLAIVEFVIPAVAILLFLSIGGMMARAVNDNHHCEGRLGLSLLWGMIWATVYVGPVAAAVIWIVAVLDRSG